jgi:hypothetical protein
VHPADASGQPTGSDHGPHVEPSWRRRVRRSAQSQVGGATQAH